MLCGNEACYLPLTGGGQWAFVVLRSHAMEFTTQYRSLLAGSPCCLAVLPAVAEQPVTDGIASMFGSGDLSVDFRYRYEYVDEDGFSDEANASTLRSRVTFQSAIYEGFSFLTEFSWDRASLYWRLRQSGPCQPGRHLARFPNRGRQRRLRFGNRSTSDLASEHAVDLAVEVREFRHG
jgi:hypothetical protein